MSAYSSSINKYEITSDTADKGKSWQNNYMYKTSYLKQSEKNVLYIFN